MPGIDRPLYPDPDRVSRPDATGYAPAPRGFSTNDGALSTNRAAANVIFLDSALTRAMDFQPSMRTARRMPDLGLATKSIAAFWVLYLALITLRAVVLQYPDFWEMLGRRSLVTTYGALLTFVIYLAMRPLASAGLGKKATVAGLLCLPAALLFSAGNYAIFYVYAPLDAAKLTLEEKAMDPLVMAFQSIVEMSLSWYFIFAAWSALYVAMSYAADLRTADRRAAAFAREAQEAQLRALRYQINPHFLFNTLNSLSALVLSHRTDIAERMLMNLSTFFRTTLTADPTADISLEEEITLQRLYLDIEQVRFPDRLRIETDVPDALRAVRVPVLILQPVVENAIKYGVARSRGAVTVRISAFEEAGRLHLKVRDDGNAPPALFDEEESTGVGLGNVCQRLSARYGNQAGCFHGPDPQGGFTVHLIMPVIRNV